MVFGSVLLAASALSASAESGTGLDDIRLPTGFAIEIFTNEVPEARSLALGEKGTIFVATRRAGRVFAVVPRGNKAPRVVTIASDLDMPNGVAFHDGDLYVAEVTRISRYEDIESTLENIPEPKIISDTFPAEHYHGWRYMDFGPDGKLHISIGAPCNVCDQEGFGNITRLNPDGSGKEIVAYGIRNSVGFTWHPDTGEMWFTDNGRDMLGDDVPPDELNRVGKIASHFGFPFCHAGEISDPEFGAQGDCGNFIAPALKLGPHVAPLGIEFYTGDMFPAEYRGQLFIAEHGSWNRSEKIGYRIMLVRMGDNGPSGYEIFADGWLNGGEVSGRPVDLLILDDGSMLVSDDKSGSIYRISYSDAYVLASGLNQRDTGSYRNSPPTEKVGK
jgi:glucose/arabinose dehydrogenase